MYDLKRCPPFYILKLSKKDLEEKEMSSKAEERTGFKYALAALGPGLILAATSIGPGSIVSSTNAGANFGYALFWWFIVMAVFRAIFNYGMNKYTIVSGKPLMVGIREKYGPVWAVLAGVFAFIGQCVYGIGNVIGAGLGLNMLFPAIPLKAGAVIGFVLCIILYFLKGLYGKVEKVMKVLVALMVVIFIASFIGTLRLPYDGTVTHSLVGFPSGATAMMLSLLGTTASLGTCAWGSSLAKEKGYAAKDLKKGGMLIDVVIGTGALTLISLGCYFVGANLLPAQPIGNGMDLANALSTIFGAFIKPVFGIGFLAAALSSMMMAPKIGVNLLLQSLNKDSGMENKTENIISILMLVFALIIVFSYGGVPAQLLTLAQIGGVINTPILGIMTILLLRNKNEMKTYRIGSGYMAALIVSYGVVMVTVINNIVTLIRQFTA